MASRRRSRRNPAADKGLMGGMDTQSMLVGAVIGGAAVYFLTKKDTAPGNEAYLPAGAAGIEKYQKAQLYKSGPLPTPRPEDTVVLSFDADPCSIGGVTAAEMQRRIGVPGRLQILGTTDFFSRTGNIERYWLAFVDGQKVVLLPDGTYDRQLSARREDRIRQLAEARSQGRYLSLYWGSWAEDHLCDSIALFAEEQGQGQPNTRSGVTPEPLYQTVKPFYRQSVPSKLYRK